MLTVRMRDAMKRANCSKRDSEGEINQKKAEGNRGRILLCELAAWIEDEEMTSIPPSASARDKAEGRGFGQTPTYTHTHKCVDVWVCVGSCGGERSGGGGDLLWSRCWPFHARRPLLAPFVYTHSH